MRAIHCLLKIALSKRKKEDLTRAYEIFHRVPVMFDEDHGVSTRQRQTQATDMGGEKETVNTRITIECLDNSMSFVGVDASI